MSVVVHNMCAMNSQRNLQINNKKMSTNTERLSSGYKINRASDNAAGLKISEGMRSQVRGLNRGAQNSQDGMSLLQVADGALSEVHEMLHRMTELTVQAANDTNTYEDRQVIQDEINQLCSEIDRIGHDTEFNTIHIFDTDPVVTYTESELVTSPSADSGYLTETTKKADGRYYPSASLDFSRVNQNNISLLYDKSFRFTCSQSCAEAFKFTLFDGDGSESHVEGKDNGQNPHSYFIDIHGLKTGEQILDKMYNYVKTNMPNGLSPGPDSLRVSHSNDLFVDGAKMNLVATIGYPTEAEAAAKFAGKTGPYGVADFSDITGSYSVPVERCALNIQSGANSWQNIQIELQKMNSTIIGVDRVNVEDYEHATAALTDIQCASEKISRMRSEFGAKFNRLESAYANTLNTSENLNASESKLRDADIGDEMVGYSIENILLQTGESMTANAKQGQETVLKLLQ